MSRAKCTLDEKVLQNVIVSHGLTLEDDDFLNRDIEKVIEKYKIFLQTVASITPRLNQTVLTKALSTVYPGRKAIATSLSKRLVEAFSFCAGKKRRSTSGSKLPTSIMAVRHAMECREQSASPPPKAAPTTSPPKVTPTTPRSADKKKQKSVDPPPLPLADAHPLSLPCEESESQIVQIDDTPDKKQRKVAKEDVFALYEVTPPRPRPREEVHHISSQEVATSSSSQEEPAVLVGPATPGSSATALPLGDTEPALKGVDPKGRVDPTSMVWICERSGEETPLVQGPDGFAIAMVGGVEVTAEYPNATLLLAQGSLVNSPKAPMKSRKKAKAKEGAKKKKGKAKQAAKEAAKGDTKKKKKKAAKKKAEEHPRKSDADEENAKEAGMESEEDTGKTEVAAPATEDLKYSKEWYKNRNYYGIRRSTDRKQIFSVGGRTPLIAKEKLEPIALNALRSLHEGTPEAVVKDAALAEYQALLG